mgnify:CR=1 FL=1|tara:strand:+ start:1152 stop:1706 length:555 start_codon:yes stop_codon:yes gene_type:complete
MSYSTQNSLLLDKLMEFYNTDNNLEKIISIINGESTISLRLIDWFATNYSKKHYVMYNLMEYGTEKRFKVWSDYKLKLRAYSKKRFDPFCRWERIVIPYKNNVHIQTTIGQLNFFKWALENKVLDYIEEYFEDINQDMLNRNSSSKKRHNVKSKNKTRKKREELSISATKTIKKEKVEIVLHFK